MNERLSFKVVTAVENADPDAICVTLFEEEDELMAWFIGPVVFSRDKASMAYLPRSARQRVAMAIYIAMGNAVAYQLNVCVIDLDNLYAFI